MTTVNKEERTINKNENAAINAFDLRNETMAACKYGDMACPCQDGDLCHYEGPDAMTPMSYMLELAKMRAEIADKRRRTFVGSRITYRGFGYGMGSQEGIDSLRRAINEHNDY